MTSQLADDVHSTIPDVASRILRDALDDLRLGILPTTSFRSGTRVVLDGLAETIEDHEPGTPLPEIVDAVDEAAARYADALDHAYKQLQADLGRLTTPATRAS